MRQASTGMVKLGTNKIIHLNIFLTVLCKNLKVLLFYLYSTSKETDFLKIFLGGFEEKVYRVFWAFFQGFSFGNWLLYLTFFGSNHRQYIWKISGERYKGKHLQPSNTERRLCHDLGSSSGVGDLFKIAGPSNFEPLESIFSIITIPNALLT